ncbi:MAG: hypothetical protein MJZ74_09210 [Muribaculaceae bacterium]|nr:hypothetical protein [Muribaculaceae bacterium]
MIILSVMLIIGIGITSARKSKDFASARGQAGAWIVAGAIIGTLVGGQATVGTAEMGYKFGFSGIWFTWGSALGCLLLYFITPRLRATGCSTLLEIIGRRYGKKAEVAGSLLSLFGMFFSIVAQQLACAALIRAVVPCSLLTALLTGTAIMLVYVVAGGMMGAGKGGLVKLILLYGSCIVCGVTVMVHTHGLSDFDTSLFNPFGRGISTDLNAIISMILGVVATQSYAQAVWAGRSDASARKGALLSALLIPPIGIACTLVGMYMQSNAPVEVASTAFPAFALTCLPHWLGGIVMGTLLVTVIGGCTGIALGSSVIVVRDLLQRPLQHSATLVRITLVAIMSLALTTSLMLTGTFINDLGFLSLGLRAASILLPLGCTMFMSHHIRGTYIIASMISSVATMLVAHAVGMTWLSPTLCGLAAGLIPIAIACIKNRNHD